MTDQPVGKTPADTEDTPPAYYQIGIDGAVHQGELIRQVWEWVPVYDGTEPKGAQPFVHKLAVVVTQECDLARDYEARQNQTPKISDLKNILFCPAMAADELRKAHTIKREQWTRVRANKVDRYQYLAEVLKEQDAMGVGHEALLIDFRGFFCVRAEELYRQLDDGNEQSARRLARLACPWREHLQQRFGTYTSRIGLPIDHFIPEGRR